MIFTKRKLQNDCQLPYVRTDMTFFCVCERGGSIISALLKGAFDWGQDEIQAYVSTGYDAKKMKRICHLPSSIFSIGTPPPLRLLSDPLNMHTLFRFTMHMCEVSERVWGPFICTVCSPIKAKWQLSLQLRYLHFFWPRHSIEQAILRFEVNFWNSKSKIVVTTKDLIFLK